MHGQRGRDARLERTPGPAQRRDARHNGTKAVRGGAAAPQRAARAAHRGAHAGARDRPRTAVRSPEDRHHRAAHGRRGARFQQPAHGGHGQSRTAEEAAFAGGRPRTSAGRQRLCGRQAGRGPDAAAARLRPASGSQARAGRRFQADRGHGGSAGALARPGRAYRQGRSRSSWRLVQVDANQLELAILNLSINARDAMPLGGHLSISAREETIVAGQADAPRSLKPGDYVRIDVVDTGVGMDQETMARATEPFFTTKGPGKGTGLGLSMVQGLAAQSGGAMTISSVVGEGTTIGLWLPRSEKPAAKISSRPTIAPTRMGTASSRESPNLRILVVDDDALVSAGTAAMLEDLGHSVIEASSGAQALDLLQEHCPNIDLVVTDHAMPGMTGLDLTRRMQSTYPEVARDSGERLCRDRRSGRTERAAPHRQTVRPDRARGRYFPCPRSGPRGPRSASDLTRFEARRLLRRAAGRDGVLLPASGRLAKDWPNVAER